MGLLNNIDIVTIKDGKWRIVDLDDECFSKWETPPGAPLEFIEWNPMDGDPIARPSYSIYRVRINIVLRYLNREWDSVWIWDFVRNVIQS